MANAQVLHSQPGKPQILRLRNCYTVFYSNGQKRLVENIHYYGPAAGVCGGPAWTASQKTQLVTYSAGVSYGGVTYYGFQTTVLTALNQLLSLGALSGGIFAKWIDQVTDADLQVGTMAPPIPTTSASTPAIVASPGLPTQGGQVGTLANRMPLDNHVTVRKFTGVAGKEWSRGRWKFAPICETQVGADELTAGAQTAWGTTTYGPAALSLKAALYQPITDGTLSGGAGTAPNLLYPVLVSSKLSQLRVAPTRVAFAALILPGVNYITGQTNPIINATIGEQRRRKEKPDVVF